MIGHHTFQSQPIACHATFDVNADSVSGGIINYTINFSLFFTDANIDATCNYTPLIPNCMVSVDISHLPRYNSLNYFIKAG